MNSTTVNIHCDMWGVRRPFGRTAKAGSTLPGMTGGIVVLIAAMLSAMLLIAEASLAVPLDSVGEGPPTPRLYEKSQNPAKPALPPLGEKQRALSGMWVNPTAPNDYVSHLRGDFTDSDGDGMTDAAEVKYGYDPDDPSSFPQEPGPVNGTGPAQVGAEGHAISYTFKDFPEGAEAQYRGFLTRLFPLLYHWLGPPAETFNCVITNMGEDTDYFMITDNGRTFLSDTDFIPRLIAHELSHAWKGKYTFTSDANWNYSDALSGFEEGPAEGVAFEIMHEYVRSYPSDEATIKLMEFEPYQYWGSRTTYNDLIKYSRWTGAGDFWTHTGGQTSRYSISATTFQEIMTSYPGFYKAMMADYYARINADPNWRSNRADLITMWQQHAPTLHGVPLSEYLDTLPVFQGKKLDEGMYVIETRRPYGTEGDQQFVTTYVNKDGATWWGILKNSFGSYNIPSYIDIMDDEDADPYWYINTQGQPFVVGVYDNTNYGMRIVHDSSKVQTGYSLGFGWDFCEDIRMEYFPVGLYRSPVTFTKYIPYDLGAREDFYFLGYQGLNQPLWEYEYVIMIGVAGPNNGTVSIEIEGETHTEPLENGVAVFRSRDWPNDMTGVLDIQVRDDGGVTRSYSRTLLEACTWWQMYQFEFLILDSDFDGVEDHIQALRTGISTTAQTVSSVNGGGSVIVHAGEGVSWTASSNADWLHIDTGDQGAGKQMVFYLADVNRNRTDSRTGTLTIAGKTVTVTQLPFDEAKWVSVQIPALDHPGVWLLALGLSLAAVLCLRRMRTAN